MNDIAEKEAESLNAPEGRVREGRFRSLVLPVLAFAGLAAFLGILAVWVPRVDLITVIGATLLLAFWDFFVRR